MQRFNCQSAIFNYFGSCTRGAVSSSGSAGKYPRIGEPSSIFLFGIILLGAFFLFGCGGGGGNGNTSAAPQMQPTRSSFQLAQERATQAALQPGSAPGSQQILPPTQPPPTAVPQPLDILEPTWTPEPQLAPTGGSQPAGSSIPGSQQSAGPGGSQMGASGPSPNQTGAQMGASVPGSPQMPSASRTNIIFAGLNWPSARIQNYIIQYVVEHGYGYETSVIPGRTEDLFQKLRSGEVDASMEIWLPSQLEEWQTALANGEVQYVGSSLGEDWQSSFVIPAYLQDEYPGLYHVDDLKEPAYRELFATNASEGRARIVACPIGWACGEKNNLQIQGYGLSEHLQPVRLDSDTDLFQDLYLTYAKQRPWLGYMWGTAEPALVLDLVRLEEPPYSDQCEFTTKACGFAPQGYRI